MSRVSLAVLVVLGLLVSPANPAAAVPCLYPPVQAPVVDPFREPSCPYCAGNRGLEYVTDAGTPVVAAAPGRVGFAGTVAGVRYVVIEHVEGFRTTYGRLDRIDTQVGRRVVTGQRVGLAGGGLFFGLRSGPEYLDPQPHLAELVARPHLVPLDGNDRRPGRPARVRCP